MNYSIPLVSICVPTYNSAQYLRPCLDSIVSQTYNNIEVIFSDNASTDNTVSILKEYAQQDGYRLNTNATNTGAGANFNRLIDLARGEYIAIYHADDFYDKTIVETSVNILQGNESVGLVGTMGSVVSSEGAYLHDIYLHEEIRRMNKSVFTFDEALLCAIRNCFVTPSIMVRSRAYKELGGFNQPKYKSACDYEMWLRIATQYGIAIIDKKLINYRIHENQGSENEVRKNIEVPDIVWVLKEYRQFIKDRQVRKYCDGIINKWLFKAAKKQNYIGQYAKSNDTLNIIESTKYWIPKIIFKTFNNLKKSVKKRTV